MLNRYAEEVCTLQTGFSPTGPQSRSRWALTLPRPSTPNMPGTERIKVTVGGRYGFSDLYKM